MTFGRQLLQARAKFAQHLNLCEIRTTPSACAKFAQHLLLVRNSHQPMRLCQTFSEDFSSEDERLGFSSLGAKVINFVDYSLNQGAPTGHKSAETPIGHESNGVVAGDRTPNQMVPLPLPLLGTNH
uniref:Uncharacterized protein n=1 Tax=Vitis vinifera TaxID=29760 RepID=A5AZA8_VITVI|nr:hypothetical protein VITISV_006690 [Vitis vinifera]